MAGILNQIGIGASPIGTSADLAGFGGSISGNGTYTAPVKQNVAANNSTAFAGNNLPANNSSLFQLNVPSQYTNGVAAKNPSQNVTQPSTTIAPKYSAPTTSASSSSNGSIGSYKGTPIYGGSQASITSQMAAIDAAQTNTVGQPTGTTQPTGGTTGTSGTTTATPTNAGFLNQLMSNTGNNSQLSNDRDTLQNTTNQEAQYMTDIAGGDQPLYFKQGEQGQAQAQYQTKLAAEQQAITNDLSEQGQNITAATAGATATLPGNQNVQVPYSNQYLNGTTGQPVNPQASGQMQSAVALEAQKVKNNQETLAQAQSNLANYSQAGLDALDQALGPNFNANTNAGSSAAQASNTQVGGTAAVNANNSVYSTQLANVANLKTAAANVATFGNQLVNNMQSLGINPSDSQYANKTINQLQSQFSSPQYATFNANIAGLQARVSDLLATGEIPTAATAGAEAIVNGNLSIGAIQATLNQINSEANAIVQNSSNTASSAYQNVTGGASSMGASNSTAGTGTFSDSSFYGS